MKKILSRTGIALCVAGILLSAIAAVAHFSPPKDPTGAGAIYDEGIDAYNKQVKQLADANPNLSTPALAKTRLQVHKENTNFGAVVGGVIIAVGLMMCYFNRSKPEVTTASEPLS